MLTRRAERRPDRLPFGRSPKACRAALRVGGGSVPIELSYCVVNTEQRQLLRYCLDAIARERAAVPFETEVLVLDNASRDGSAGTARAHGATTEVIALEQRAGKGENDSTLLRRARGRYCLLLNEDSELEPGTTMALHEALDADPAAAVAGATLVTHGGAQQPSAWRFPGPGSALLTALWLHRRLVVQSRGVRIREVAWVQSAALLVRRDAAEAMGYFDPAFFVFSTRSTSAGGCATPAGGCSTCPTPAPSATSRCPTAATRAGGSSSSRAIATATCASTTHPAPRGRCGG
jgi:hypothetical protein